MRLRVLALLAAALGGCQRGSGAIHEALGDAPDARFRVRLLRSSDAGATWTLDPRVLAHDVTSLHACTYQGEVWVSGLRFVTEIPWWESAFPAPFVDVFRSSDGAAWRAERIPLKLDAHRAIDPACAVGPEGLEMWVADLEGVGDPAQGSRDARIWRTRWNGSDAFEGGEVAFHGTSVVDPSPVYGPDGTLRLYLNERGARIVEARGDRLESRWEGVTVPDAVATPSGLLVLAQRADQPQRVLVRSLEGGALGPVRTWDLTGLRTCESPSLTTLGDTWLLFCVDRPVGTPPSPHAGAPR